jgi:hypothetical protein
MPKVERRRQDTAEKSGIMEEELKAKKILITKARKLENTKQNLFFYRTSSSFVLSSLRVFGLFLVLGSLVSPATRDLQPATDNGER